MGRGFGKGGFGGLGGLGDIGKMMKQVQKAQDDMAALQEEMEATRVEASSGGGMVKATVSGKAKLVDLQIRPEAVDPDDVEMLQDLIVAAIQEAEHKAEELAQQKMQELTAGLNLPPGLGGLM